MSAPSPEPACRGSCQVPAADVKEGEKLIASMASGTEKLSQLISSGKVSDETTEVRRAPAASAAPLRAAAASAASAAHAAWLQPMQPMRPGRSLCGLVAASAACVRACGSAACMRTLQACMRALCYGRSLSHMCRLQVQTAVLADLSKLEGLIAAPTPPVTVPAEFNHLPQLKKRAIVRPSRRCTTPRHAAQPRPAAHPCHAAAPLATLQPPSPRCAPSPGGVRRKEGA